MILSGFILYYVSCGIVYISGSPFGSPLYAVSLRIVCIYGPPFGSILYAQACGIVYKCGDSLWYHLLYATARGLLWSGDGPSGGDVRGYIICCG